MIVYKFGGASIASALRVRSVEHILTLAPKERRKIVVVSALGKSTNALEEIVKTFFKGDKASALEQIKVLEKSHYTIASELQIKNLAPLDKLFNTLKREIEELDPKAGNFDLYYDNFVSYGELLSTTILAEYLNRASKRCKFVDMRKCLITDAKHREANIDFAASTIALQHTITESEENIILMQGFIGGTPDGKTTTLGREGSDYSAAAVANMLNASSVTIWKDVDGVLNADPRIFPNTTLIEELSYIDAVELAFSGAQIIHPKSIKPLENRGIKLYVRPYLAPHKSGTVIGIESDIKRLRIPIYIVKQDQIMISIRPKDFSFVLEDSLAHIFALLNKYRQKVGIIQSSAIRITISVDSSPYFEELLNELNKSYIVKFNTNLKLLTIRGSFNDEIINRAKEGHEIYLSQRSRRSYKILYAQ